MLIPPRYTLTPEISGLLSDIEASKHVIDAVAVPQAVEVNLRRQSHLKSSLFSARIEGNNLTMDDFAHVASKDQKKAEITNILKAMTWIQDTAQKDFVEKDILTIHKFAMHGLTESDNLGRLRRNMEAIFNSAGIAIYMPPSPRQVPAAVAKLVRYINSDKERFVPVKAVLAHYTFEKIHPFLDGNGRVGRLLIQKVLAHGGYGMKGMLSIEEYYEAHRAEYYRMLEEPEKDLTEYVAFMLTAIAQTAKMAREAILTKKTVEPQDFLLPRRAEILQIIKDHKMVNFDQIRRRFLTINERTLRFDLLSLQKGGFVRKLGTTKGVYYELN